MFDGLIGERHKIEGFDQNIKSLSSMRREFWKESITIQDIYNNSITFNKSIILNQRFSLASAASNSPSFAFPG